MPHRHDQRHISQVFLGSLKLKIDIGIRFIQRKSNVKPSQTLLKKKQQKIMKRQKQSFVTQSMKEALP